jgi:hypothetical protein
MTRPDIRSIVLLLVVAQAVAAYRRHGGADSNDLHDAAVALSALPTRTPPPAVMIDIETLIA